MFDIPIIKPRQPLAAATPHAPDPDGPITVTRGLVPATSSSRARSPRVVFTSEVDVGGVFAREKLSRAKVDRATAAGVFRLLQTSYRGHFWRVEVDSHQGVCTITIPVLLGNWKYIIHLDKLTPQAVIRAGGEILERFKIPRSAIDVAAFCEARKRRVSRTSQKVPT
jgi:hypothetical protein